MIDGVFLDRSMTLPQQDTLGDRWVMGADEDADDVGKPTDDVGKQHTWSVLRLGLLTGGNRIADDVGDPRDDVLDQHTNWVTMCVNSTPTDDVPDQHTG